MEMKKFEKGKILKNTYIIERCFDQGGMNSYLYLVTPYNDRNNFLAAKAIYKTDDVTDDFWQKFSDECVTAQRVAGKDNLVQTYDVFWLQEENCIVIVMEYIDGSSLEKYIRKNGKLQPKLAINIFNDILKGIKELHGFEHQIIHRDLKPENILISKDLMKVKIIDFGISSVIDNTTTFLDKQEKKCFTNEDSFFGTYPYINPDCMKKGKPFRDESNRPIITVQYDFFALGVIFYEMLMGEKPFYAKDYNTIDTINFGLKFDINNISKIDPSISTSMENLIFRCMASKDEDLKYRYTNIDEIIFDLNGIKQKIDNNESDTIPLLKPINKRVFQKITNFDIEKQKQKEPWYKQWWFFITVCASCIVIVILMFVILFELFI